MYVKWFLPKAMILFESSHCRWTRGPITCSRQKMLEQEWCGPVKFSAVMVQVYIENAWVCSPCFRPARHCHRPGSQGKQHWHFLYKKAGDKKERRPLWLSGKSNKGLSTAVRMTQGNLPGSINSTLFSVPKPKGWHVKTLLSIPASVQISVGADPARCWAPLSRSLETLLSWQQNKWESIICSQRGPNWTVVPIVPVFTVILQCLHSIQAHFLWGVSVWGALTPAQGKALTWNYVNRIKPSEEQLQRLFHLPPNCYCK